MSFRRTLPENRVDPPPGRRYTCSTVKPLCTTMLLLCILTPSVAGIPRVDLTEWDPETQGTRMIDGVWAFFPGELLDPRTVDTGLWQEFSMPGTWEGGTGSATFAVRVALPEGLREGALRIEPASTAYRLYLNRQVVAHSGTPAEHPEGAVPLRAVRTVAFTVPERVAPGAPGEVEVVLHVSNWDHRVGGMWRPIVVGTPAQILAKDLIDVSYDILLWGLAIAFALYNGAIYLLGSRRSTVPLFLGAFFLAVAIRVPLLGSMIITRIVPAFPWHVQLALEYLTGHLIVVFLAITLEQTFPRLLARRYRHTAIGLMGVFTAYLFLAGVTRYSHIIHFFLIVAVALLVWPLVVLAGAARRGNRDARLGTVPVGVVLAIMVSEWAHFSELIPSRDGLPLGFLLGIFSSPLASALSAQILMNIAGMLVVFAGGSALLFTTSRIYFRAAVRESLHLPNPTAEEPPGISTGGHLAPVAGEDPLTTREEEITTLVAQGLSNKEIAAALHISEATVRTHIYRIFRKTGAANRTELARMRFSH